MHKVIIRVMIVLSIFASFLNAQVTKNYDVRANNAYWIRSNMSCDFHVKRMNINYVWMTNGSYDDFLGSALKSYSSNYSTDNFSTATDYAKSFFNIGEYEAKALVSVAYVSAALIVQMIQDNNIGYRSYAFHCPTAGVYQLTVSLVGDIDKPRNRVLIAGPEGSRQLDDDNPSSNTTRTYTVNLSAGAHQLTVALGKGISSVFHNAGTLNGVVLNNDSYCDWRDEISLGTAGYRTTAVIPSVGGSYHSAFSFSVPTTSNFPSIYDGSAICDLNTVKTSGEYVYIDSKVSVNVKNCYGDVLSLPANFLNADATYSSSPLYVASPTNVLVNVDLTRKPDITLSGSFETCSSAL